MKCFSIKSIPKTAAPIAAVYPTEWSENPILTFGKCFFKSLIANIFTSLSGVGYSVLQWRRMISHSFVPAFTKISIQFSISSIVAIPEESITFFPSLLIAPIRFKYGKFVISPEGIFHKFCPIESKNSTDPISNGVENTSKPISSA